MQIGMALGLLRPWEINQQKHEPARSSEATEMQLFRCVDLLVIVLLTRD